MRCERLRWALIAGLLCRVLPAGAVERSAEGGRREHDESPPAVQPGAPVPIPAPPPVAAVAAATPGIGEPNQPPRIVGILPGQFDRADAVLNIGEETRVTLDVSDPEGLPVTVSALGLPAGAEFSEPLRMLRWTPSAAQRGRHVLRFVVSDGVRETSRTWNVQVIENRAPAFASALHTVHWGEQQQIGLTASDADGDPLSYTAQALPAGAVLDDSGTLRWRPLESQIGDHSVRVTASDGHTSTTQDIVVRVEIAPQRLRELDNWESYLLPGVGYTLYAPREEGTFGLFHGVALEVSIGAWIHRNDNRGPSHGRIYVSAEILDSTEELSVLFAYALGFSLSLERNPQRTWLIPTYGVDVGGIVQDDVGSRFQSTPYLGLHFYSNRNVFITGRAGYRLVPTALERLGGWHASVTGDFSVW